MILQYIVVLQFCFIDHAVLPIGKLSEYIETRNEHFRLVKIKDKIGRIKDKII